MKSLIIAFALGFVLFGSVFSQNRSGTYYRVDKYGIGDVTFRDVGRGKSRRLSFYISIAGAQRGTCIGDHRGKAKWVETNIAEYNPDFNEVDSDREAIGCRLTFVFSGSRVTVRETNCNDYHGAACQFEGRYLLRRKSK